MTTNRKLLSTPRSLLSFVLPILCVDCQVEEDWICRRCVKQITLNRSDTCFCGKSAAAGVCLKHRTALGIDGLTTLFSYSDPIIRQIIHSLKYNSYSDAAIFLADRFRPHVLQLMPKGDWTVTAVPIGRAHLRKRGFNQSEILAKHLTKPMFAYSGLLKKVKESKPQVKLKKSDRLTNVRRSMKYYFRGEIPEQVIVVDDVITTGSTLKEAARALKKAGVRKVWALAICHG